MSNAQTIEAVIQNLKALFKEKDHLKGVDDWDTFIGCLVALEKVGAAIQIEEQAAQPAEENAEE